MMFLEPPWESQRAINCFLSNANLSPGLPTAGWITPVLLMKKAGMFT